MAPALSANTDPNSKLNINPKAEEGVDEVAVNVSEITRNNDIKMLTADDPDATECSSSFGDTISTNENCSGLSDAEVESQFYDDNGLTSAFDGFANVFPMRKKKLTSHWRSFIRPLMWRCKWAELRIKELGSQVRKYDRDIAAQSRRKKLALEQHALEGCGSRSFPFNFQWHRRKAMKRRKRRRVEDSTDTKTFMSNHNLFSYFENKKSEADGACIPEDVGNAVQTEQNTTGNSGLSVNSIDSFLKEEDNSFLEKIFCKIEIVHNRVHKLKGQLDLVMTKNVGRFSSSENLHQLIYQLIFLVLGTVQTEQNTTGNSGLSVNSIDSFLKEEDNSFLEKIFCKIEIVHNRVHKLKGQLDLVMTKNVGRFSSSENLHHLVPYDVPTTSSVRSPTFSACNGDTVSVGGLCITSTPHSNNNNGTNISDFDMKDFAMPESVVSSYGEAIQIPDIIESTVGHLSSADVTQHHQRQIGDSSENIVDNIHNEDAEAERDTSKKKQYPEPTNSGEEESTNPLASQEQTSLKVRLGTDFHFPKNKRKRGERKAGGAGGWSRQCPGEPDSQ